MKIGRGNKERRERIRERKRQKERKKSKWHREWGVCNFCFLFTFFQQQVQLGNNKKP